MTKKFDPTKPVQTRDGRAARILAKDIKDTDYPIIAAVTLLSGVESVESFTSSGTFFKNPDREISDDLVNIPEKNIGYVNIYKDDEDDLFYSIKSSPAEAQRQAGNLRTIARVKIEYTEGQFDE